ncbi:MAG: hypothetical protein K6C95_01095 [Lachnospiraceae bacterium]|nr:hypothetical protein [Lachnospiraceae bacterium]
MKKTAVTDIPFARRLGRTAAGGSSLSVFWTASGIEFKLKATDLFIELESIYSGLELWIDIMIDGELSQRIQLPPGISTIPVFRNLSDNGEARSRTVRILRDTQAMAGDEVSVLRLISAETDDDAVFEQIPEASLRLEFIGDSITSGEGAGLEKQIEWAPIVFSAVEGYAYKTGILLNADVNVLSSSGWGLYASWDADTACALPRYYDEVCGLEKSDGDAACGSLEPWDFSSYVPDAIVINLGTNDSTALKNSDRWTPDEFNGLFREAAVSFLKKLRDKNPKSAILWAYGMLGNEMAEPIKDAILAYSGETGDKNVYYYEFKNCTGDRLGVRAHPNRRAHDEAASALSEEIMRILKKTGGDTK